MVFCLSEPKRHKKELIVSADDEIKQYYSTRIGSYALWIKKLYENTEGKIFEARVTDKIRILWVESEVLVSFVALGNHNEIRRYLKNAR